MIEPRTNIRTAIEEFAVKLNENSHHPITELKMELNEEMMWQLHLEFELLKGESFQIPKKDYKGKMCRIQTQSGCMVEITCSEKNNSKDILRCPVCKSVDVEDELIEKRDKFLPTPNKTGRLICNGCGVYFKRIKKY